MVIAGNVYVENLRQAIDLEVVVQATMNDSKMHIRVTFSTVDKGVMPSGLIPKVENDLHG